jgi:hypothetical protein
MARSQIGDPTALMGASSSASVVRTAGARRPAQSPAQVRVELARLELVGCEGWADDPADHECRKSGSEHLCLELVELGLSDRSTVE